MYILIVILHVLVSLVLAVSVLLQSSKGGGLAGAFGGSGGAPQQLLGSRGMSTLLHKITIWCGIGFMLTSLALFMMSGDRSASSGGVLQNAQQDGTLNADSPAPPIQDSEIQNPGLMDAEAEPTPAAGDGTEDGGASQTDPPQGDDQ